MRLWSAVCAGIVLLGLSILRGESRASSVWSATSPEQAKLALRVCDPDGRPIEARVRVAPSDWAERVRLGSFGDPRRTLDVRGAELTLAPGDYRVFVSRGPEWSIAEFKFHAQGGTHALRNLELRHEVSLPGWHGADLHVHTPRSPDAAEHGGGVRALDLIAEGVELAVGTDHNRIGGLGRGIESLAGAEITTWQPEIGHFNAFPLRHLPRWRRTTPEALFADLMRDPAVFVQINHPRLDDHIAYFALGGFEDMQFARAGFDLEVDGLEVWNGFDISRPERVAGLLREWRAWVSRGHRLTATGGSDSHGSAQHRPGYPRTYVHTARAAELASRLKAGQAFVTNGPLLELRVEGAGPGETVKVGAGDEVDVELSVRAPSWMRVETVELWADETLRRRARVVPAPRGRPLAWTLHTRLALEHASVLSAVAHGGAGLERLLGRSGVLPLAFTNAVRFERAAPEQRDAAGETLALSLSACDSFATPQACSPQLRASRIARGTSAARARAR
jgi:hypothetical protein